MRRIRLLIRFCAIQWADHRKCDGSSVSVAAGGAFDHNEDGPLPHVEAFEESRRATTESLPDLAHTETGEGVGYAHSARKEEITRAALEGGPIKALCGFRL